MPPALILAGDQAPRPPMPSPASGTPRTRVRARPAPQPTARLPPFVCSQVAVSSDNISTWQSDAGTAEFNGGAAFPSATDAQVCPAASGAAEAVLPCPGPRTLLLPDLPLTEHALRRRKLLCYCSWSAAGHLGQPRRAAGDRTAVMACGNENHGCGITQAAR